MSGDMTRLIGTLSIRRDNTPRRRERKHLDRLIADLCVIASAMRELANLEEAK